DLVAIDLENFALLFGVLARLEPNLDLRVVLEEVQKYVPLELDFCHEAANAERMAEHLAARADVLVPAIVREWSTRRVLVMDYAPGVRVTDVAGLRALGLDPADVARRLLELFCEQLLVHGFFHADPHPGNILVQPGGRLVLLDFGLVKELPAGFRDGIVRLVSAIVRGDSAAVANAFRALGFRTRDDGDDSLAWLGEAFLGWGSQRGMRGTRPARIARSADAAAAVKPPAFGVLDRHRHRGVGGAGRTSSVAPAFAGRDMRRARVTERSTLASGPDPRCIS